MTDYQQQLEHLKETIYANQEQIDTIKAVRKYINRNYESELNLDSLAQHQQVSKYHLIRLFKRYLGLTPHQYLIDKRIEHARIHLSEGLTVTETCFAVGFESLGSFSTLFKTKTGKSPAQFRKEQFSRNK